MKFFASPDGSGWFLDTTEVQQTIDDRGITDAIVESSAAYFLCDGGVCGTCAQAVLDSQGANNQTYGQFLNEYESLGDGNCRLPNPLLAHDSNLFSQILEVSPLIDSLPDCLVTKRSRCGLT